MRAIIAWLMAFLALFGTVPALAQSPEGAVHSVLITENGKPIGSLSGPVNGQEVMVGVTEGRQYIQAIIQINLPGREQVIILTGLQDPIITALSDRGRVGSVIRGGLVLNEEHAQAVLATIGGTNPLGVRHFDVVQVIRLSQESLIKEVSVRALVRAPPRKVPLHWVLLIILGLFAIAGSSVLIWRWRRRHRLAV